MIKILRIAALGLALLLMPLVAFAGALQYRIGVDGLACPFCAYGIEKKFSNTEGVDKVDVDINAGVVTVTMKEGAALSEAQAAQIVKDAGFTLRDFEEIETPAKSD